MYLYKFIYGYFTNLLSLSQSTNYILLYRTLKQVTIISPPTTNYPSVYYLYKYFLTCYNICSYYK